jgi:TolB-like protein
VADGYQSDAQQTPLTDSDARLLFKLRPLDGTHPSSSTLVNSQPGGRPGNSIPVGSRTGVQNLRRLAVLEFQGKGLEDDVMMTLSDTARGGALGGIEGRGIAVMTRENMLVLLKDMGKKECGEGDCEIETARNLGADFVVSGRVIRMEKLYVVTLKLHETKGGTLLGTTTAEGTSQVEVLRLLRERGRQLVSEGLRLQGDL